MSRKNNKKGKASPKSSVVYQELPSLESETPEEMLKRLGGVAAHATSESTRIPIAPPLTPHGGGVPDPTGSGAHSVTTPPAHHESGHLGATPDWHEQAHQDEQAAKTAESGGHYHQAAKDWDAAGAIYNNHDVYNSAAKDYQNSATDYTKAGDKASEAQEYNNAAAAFEAAGHHDQSGVAYEQAGQAYLDSGHHNEALTAFNNALTNFNNIAQPTADQLVDIALAYTGQGRAYQSLGHPNDAIAAFNSAVTDFHNASNEVDNPSTQLLMGLAQAHYGLGLAMQNVGESGCERQFGLAVENYQSAFEGDNAPTVQQWQDRAEACSQLAQSLASNGHESEAHRAEKDAGICFDHAALDFRAAHDYSNAAQMFVKGGQAYSEAGLSTFAAKSYQEGGVEFSKVGNHNEAAQAYDNAGYLYGTLGQHSDAAHAYDDAGKAFSKAGDQNGAQAAFDMMNGQNDLSNNHPNAAAGEFDSAAQILSRAGHHNQAAEAYGQAGQAFSQAGHYNEAAQAYGNEAGAYSAVVQGGDIKDQAWANIGQAYTSQGEAYLRAGHHNEALTAFNNAMSNFNNVLQPTNQESAEMGLAYSGQGQAYQSLGHHNEAVTAFNNAIQQFYSVSGAEQSSSQLLIGLAQAHYGLGLAMQSLGDPLSKVGEQFAHSVNDYLRAFKIDADPTAQQWQDRAEAYASLGQSFEKLPDYSSETLRAFRDAGECYGHVGSDFNTNHVYKDAAQAYENAATYYGKANELDSATKAWKDAGSNFIEAAKEQDLSNSQNGQKDLQDAYNAFKSAAGLETGSAASSTWAEAKSQLTDAANYFAGTTPPDTEREKLAKQLASQCPST